MAFTRSAVQSRDRDRTTPTADIFLKGVHSLYGMRHLFKVAFAAPGSSSLALTGTRKRFRPIGVTIPWRKSALIAACAASIKVEGGS
jgi:hypothetical protein